MAKEKGTKEVKKEGKFPDFHPSQGKKPAK